MVASLMPRHSWDEHLRELGWIEECDGIWGATDGAAALLNAADELDRLT